jgi:agmatinase
MSKEDKIKNFDPNGVGLDNGHFIGLPFNEAEAQLVLLSVPWDVTVSYADGTATGPANILETSPQLDLFDPDVPDAWKLGLYFRPPDPHWLEKNKALRARSIEYIRFLEEGGELAEDTEMQRILREINQECEALKKWVRKECEALLDSGKKVAIVGGEHSSPLGLMEALAERYPAFGILQIDAHMDLRKAYEGFTYSHASIFYNALQLGSIRQLTQVGIRDYCEEEVRVAEASGKTTVYYDHQIRRAQYAGKTFAGITDHIIASLPQQVYISFDIDGLQPQLCPNTGTPVPGGLDFNEAIYLIQQVVQSGREIIGFDLSEVAGLGHEWDGNVGARVLYRLSNAMMSSYIQK